MPIKTYPLLLDSVVVWWFFHSLFTHSEVTGQSSIYHKKDQYPSCGGFSIRQLEQAVLAGEIAFSPGPFKKLAVLVRVEQECLLFWLECF